MPNHTFVGRDRELRQLHTYLETALAGSGQVAFAIDGAGSGKTALLTAFARRAQEARPDLLVALGTCNVQTGLGGPYLPFRMILALLAGGAADPLVDGTIRM